MASPARKPATYEDLLKLPDDRIGEIVRAEPFDAIDIDLLRLWGEERAPQAG
jgi:hypothetical protein